jgi:hypothetical protein
MYLPCILYIVFISTNNEKYIFFISTNIYYIYITITPTCFDTLNHPQEVPKLSVMLLQRDTILERTEDDTNVSKHVGMIIIEIMLKLSIYFVHFWLK